MSFFDKTADEFEEFLVSRLQLSGVAIQLPAATIATWYREFLEQKIPNEVRIGSVQPDFEQVFVALQNEVTKNESWREAATSGTGTMILSLIAAGIVYNQTSIIRAAQETSLDTARLDNSVYSITRMLGVRISRKTPSKVKTLLTNSQPVSEQIIPAYTRWSVGRDTYFNRDIVVFQQGQTSLENIELHEGNVVEETFEATGKEYQRYEVGLPDFSISNEDVRLFVNNVEWFSTDQGIWSHTKENVFGEYTTAKGNVEIQFGNGINGNIPPTGSTIRIQYARTLGTRGANKSTNEDVVCQTNSNINGLTSSKSAGGGDEEDAQFYKLNAPYIHAAQNKAVTRDQYRSIVMTYPGIVDAEVRGQQDIDPNDPKLFNRVLVTALRYNGVAWTEDEWSDFKVWLNQRSLIGVQLVREDPEPTIIDVKAQVFCLQNTNLNATRLALVNHLRSVFSIRRGSLGRNLFRDDIHKALRNEPSSRKKVTHTILLSPSFDIYVRQYGFVNLRNIELDMQYSERSSVDA